MTTQSGTKKIRRAHPCGCLGGTVRPFRRPAISPSSHFAAPKGAAVWLATPIMPSHFTVQPFRSPQGGSCMAGYPYHAQPFHRTYGTAVWLATPIMPSHFTVPTARLYGWLPLSCPYGASQYRNSWLATIIVAGYPYHAPTGLRGTEIHGWDNTP